MTVLGCDAAAYQDRLRRRRLRLGGAAAGILCLNAALVLLRTEQTHTLFLWLNIVSDLALVWSALAAGIAVTAPERRLLRLYRRGERHGKSREVRVLEVAGEPLCIQGFSCRTVRAEGEDGVWELYLIEDTIELEPGRRYRLGTVDQIVCRGEVLE